jgi:hypothetical protein
MARAVPRSPFLDRETSAHASSKKAGSAISFRMADHRGWHDSKVRARDTYGARPRGRQNL